MRVEDKQWVIQFKNNRKPSINQYGYLSRNYRTVSFMRNNGDLIAPYTDIFNHRLYELRDKIQRLCCLKQGHSFEAATLHPEVFHVLNVSYLSKKL